MTDSDDLAAEIDRLGGKLDRVTALLVVLLVVQLFHVLGEAQVTSLVLAGLFGLVGLFVVLVAYGVARSF
ncbi:hypothetical protein [Halorussus aquaticus]|uniref:Uncharacterized protein n=1 Tax=Halorussus aquaticus TaxID=2953748 RepID=A0ABD5Q267_9EURY|nr:hypothetical protein [Halorussus aquaticus]